MKRAKQKRWTLAYTEFYVDMSDDGERPTKRGRPVYQDMRATVANVMLMKRWTFVELPMVVVDCVEEHS